MTSRRSYRTDLSDARWALIEPTLAAWRAARAETGLGLSEPVHDLRETVYDYYAKWAKDGTTESIHDTLRGQVRTAAGRSEEPSAAIMDAQSIRTSGRAHFRLVDAASPVGPRLRDAPRTLRNDDLLGNDRQHEPAAHCESTQTWRDDPAKTGEPSVT